MKNPIKKLIATTAVVGAIFAGSVAAAAPATAASGAKVCNIKQSLHPITYKLDTLSTYFKLWPGQCITGVYGFDVAEYPASTRVNNTPKGRIANQLDVITVANGYYSVYTW